MSKNYGIVNGEGTMDRSGFATLEAARVAARQHANRRGEAVDIYDASSDAEPRPTVETVMPVHISDDKFLAEVGRLADRTQRRRHGRVAGLGVRGRRVG